VRQRLNRFVKLWVDLFSRHLLLDHASAIAFQVLKALVPLTLLGIALLGVLGQRSSVELDELLRADATRGERGVLELLFGYGR
jgi:uncharacterized BrkB/YihY/UPF0761 family membrane protein